MVRIKLSESKLQSMLLQKNIVICSVFLLHIPSDTKKSRTEVSFLECKCVKENTSFILYIPQKYLLDSISGECKKIFIKGLADDGGLPRHKKYLEVMSDKINQEQNNESCGSLFLLSSGMVSIIYEGKASQFMIVHDSEEEKESSEKETIEDAYLWMDTIEEELDTYKTELTEQNLKKMKTVEFDNAVVEIVFQDETGLKENMPLYNTDGLVIHIGGIFPMISINRFLSDITNENFCTSLKNKFDKLKELRKSFDDIRMKKISENLNLCMESINNKLETLKKQKEGTFELQQRLERLLERANGDEKKEIRDKINKEIQYVRTQQLKIEDDTDELITNCLFAVEEILRISS